EPQQDAMMQVSTINDLQTTPQTFAHAFLEALRPLVANGALSVDRTLTLSRNAVIDPPFVVTITAGPADWSTAASVGQLGQHDISGGGQNRTSVIIDFGVMRTISGVALTTTSQFQVLRVTQWTGTGFAPTPIVTVRASALVAFVGALPPIDNTTPKFD